MRVPSLPFPRSGRSLERRGAVLVLAAALIVVIFAFLAFTVDTGYMAIVGQELQAAADAAALGSIVELENGTTAVRTTAKYVAENNDAGGEQVKLTDSDIELGTFDFATKTFVPGEVSPNAVRVTARATDRPLFFAPAIGHDRFTMRREAISMLNPRDIVFVVDLSGSMNDDTEPCWATTVIEDEFGPAGYPNVGAGLMQDLFDDFGYGPFPGTHQYMGQPLGLPMNDMAYADMTDDEGPLSKWDVPAAYRIYEWDDEATRKQRAYSWMIDQQIAVVMPNALPTPDSAKNYAYWAKYLDYIMDNESVGANPPDPEPEPTPDPDPEPTPDPTPDPDPDPNPEPPPPEPPQGSLQPLGRPSFGHFALRRARPRTGGELASASRAGLVELFAAGVFGDFDPGLPRQGSTAKVYLPPSQDHDRIQKFNNPNYYTFPGASDSELRNWRNRIGYVTYVQFMLDWGRNRAPELVDYWDDPATSGGRKTPLSLESADCPLHSESTAGGDFDFPPRTQPMHATRRSLIAAIQVVKEMNQGVSSSGADRVSIVTFDEEATLVLPLTANYTAAMQACTTLQAASDIGRTTATENGLALAREHLKPVADGGSGRSFTQKVCILLTDGVPNAWQSSSSDISDYAAANPSGEYYGGGYDWLDAALMQASRMQGDDSLLFSVGMGLGADYDFLDRMARMATTDEGGQSPRGSGNPAEYEARLTEIFEDIIKSPGSRLVK